MHFLSNLLVLAILTLFTAQIKCARFAPYIDITEEGLEMIEVYQMTGVKAFTLAFVSSGQSGECEPTWGAKYALNDTYITKQINDIKAIGGELIVATGGATGPYLEINCNTPEQLANAYNKALEYVGSTHLDVDIEAPISFDRINQAIALLQNQKPQIKVSFTVMVQGEDYGLNDALGIDLLKNALKNKVRIDLINPMAMEFWTTKSSWGEAIIDVAEDVIHQIKEFWPNKCDEELYGMLGITPMIGRNLNGKAFELSHANQLVDWANTKGVSFLSFWSIGRDNGGCANGSVSPHCSGIVQSALEFTRIFSKFNPSQNTSVCSSSVNQTSINTTTTSSSNNNTNTNNGLTVVSCIGKDNQFIVHETDCNKYYWCFDGEAHLSQCVSGTIWDNVNHACNFPELVTTRLDCLSF